MHGTASLAGGRKLAERAATARARAMSDVRFLLKTVPPRLGRGVLPRPRLEKRWTEVSDRTAICANT